MQNELVSGFYTIRDAAGLIALDVAGFSEQSIRKHFGATRRYTASVISPRSIDGIVRDISFLDLIELRFIAHFRNAGVSGQSLRRVAERARELFGDRPFARNDIVWKTDGRRLFADAAADTGDRRLLELVDRQYQFEHIVESFLLEGLEWSPSNLAQRWRPREKEYERIIVDPRVSFGQPSLEESGISATTLFDAWIAEEGNVESVANWFDIGIEDVREAVRFHEELPYH